MPGFMPLLGPLMAALDADRDGELSAEEIANAAEALKTLDADGDGRLSREELRPRFPGPGGPGGFGGPGRGGPGAGGPGAGNFVERIMSFDADGDGSVTKEELPGPMQRMLQRADTDGDGALSRAEVEAMAGQFAPGGGPGRAQGRGGRQPNPGGRPQRRQPPE